MSLTRYSGSVRSMIYCAALLAFTASILVIIGKNGGSRSVSAQDGPVVESPAASFPANPGSLGAIADGANFDCDTPGAPRNVTFDVTGIPGAPTTVGVAITFGPAHTWVGDLDVTLRAPNGTTETFVFSFTNGDSSDAAGPYDFNDTAVGGWWAAAAAAGSGVAIPSGAYRSSNGAGTNTSLNTAFAGIPTSNGTWTLEFLDFCLQDTGSVSAATLTLTGVAGTPTPTPRDAMADFDADGKTDPAVIRVGAGANGQATWWIKLSSNNFAPGGGPAFTATDWGRAADTFVPADYDGDFKDDIAVWRPGIQGQFFIIRSTNSTFRIEDWGSTGDDPTVVGDYNGDDKDDIAVYRPGTTPTGNSFWWWKLEGGSFTSFQWGSGIDFAAPGDYDGDKKMDYAVQRPNGAVGEFWIWRSLTQTFTATTFGTATDLVVPGDYDNDLKTDIAVVGTQGSNWLWSFRPSGGGPDVAFPWGNAVGDILAPGDYNGDGMADFAIWRFGSQSTFWAVSPNNTGLVVSDWGANDDDPVTSNFVH